MPLTSHKHSYWVLIYIMLKHFFNQIVKPLARLRHKFEILQSRNSGIHAHFFVAINNVLDSSAFAVQVDNWLWVFYEVLFKLYYIRPLYYHLVKIVH